MRFLIAQCLFYETPGVRHWQQCHGRQLTSHQRFHPRSPTADPTSGTPILPAHRHRRISRATARIEWTPSVWVNTRSESPAGTPEAVSDSSLGSEITFPERT